MYLISKTNDNTSSSREIVAMVENKNLAENFCRVSNFYETIQKKNGSFYYQEVAPEDMQIAAWLEKRKEVFDAINNLDAALTTVAEREKEAQEKLDKENSEKKA